MKEKFLFYNALKFIGKGEKDLIVDKENDDEDNEE